MLAPWPKPATRCKDDALRCADGSSALVVDGQETHNADSQSTRGVRNQRPEGPQASPVDDVHSKRPADRRVRVPACAAWQCPVGTEQFGDAGASSQARCSNRTLHGSYALNIDETIIAGPNRLLLRGVAMREFDGRGNVSQVDFTTVNGAAAGTYWRSGSGTYELNPDCTGTMEIIQSDGSPTLRLRLVVGDHGLDHLRHLRGEFDPALPGPRSTRSCGPGTGEGWVLACATPGPLY